MKKTKLFLLTVLALVLCLPAFADEGRIIPFEQLPDAAKTLLKTYFADKTPLIVKVDWDEYEVIYQSGEKVEFDLSGNWKEVNCRTYAVPAALVPEQIKAVVKTQYQDAAIVKLKKGALGYDVKLISRIELEFNRDFVIVDIDIDD